MADQRGSSGGHMLCLAPQTTRHAMPTAHTTRLQELEQCLILSKNADGGWAYHRGKKSRLEPTCWALLALGERADPVVLRTWPAADGLLLERRDGTPNYAFHGLAALTLNARRVTHERGNSPILGALQRVRGEALPPSKINRQDNSLQGWSWIGGTFSWVEPTAWCLLALKQCARAGTIRLDSERIRVAERLLIDRCCRDGGWNYGNANMLGQELRPFVASTALALLAMQDRRDVPAIERSIDFLTRAAGAEVSGPSLALAFIALSRLRRPASAVRDALIGQVPTTLEFGNQMAAAMCLYALRAEESHDAFAL
jgi:hypothetical protein